MPWRRRRIRTGASAARLAVALAVAVGVLSPSATSRAQEVTTPALTAAYLFNFVKFTNWPADALPDAAPLMICVVNDQTISRALKQAVGGRVVLGHQIEVVEVDGARSLRACHVAYLAGPRSEVQKAVETVRDAPVLTVSDIHAFRTTGGIVQLHVQQGQLRFAIVVDAARRARLQINARLLALARQP